MYELLDKSNTADPDKNYNILYSVISTSLNLYVPKQGYNLINISTKNLHG